MDKSLSDKYTDNMSQEPPIGFEWDCAKAASNVVKHDVKFEEAATVFDDYHARVIDDPDHSTEEARFVILGLSQQAHLLTVCYCNRKNGASIRIISARKATKQEAKQYWRFYHEG